MNDDEIRLRLFDLVREYADEPLEQRFHHVLSIVEVAEGMDLPAAEVERLAEAGAIPGRKEPDGSWIFLVEVFLWFLAEPSPEDMAWMREALEARPIRLRVVRERTLEDAAHILRLHVDAVRLLAVEGILTGHCGEDGVWMFSFDDLMAYAARLAREA